MDLSKYTGILPYASELFGVYQPLIGWKSKLTKQRYNNYRIGMYNDLVVTALGKLKPNVDVKIGQGQGSELLRGVDIKITGLNPMRFAHELAPYISPKIDSCVARLVRAKLGKEPPTDWKGIITYEKMNVLLDRIPKIISTPTLLEKESEVKSYVWWFFENSPKPMDQKVILEALFKREITVAGYLVFLVQHTPAVLNDLFFRKPRMDINQVIKFEDPLLNFGNERYEAILSPISIIHLYREYFFELDSFLGPAVGHVWLSPGGVVDLIEINTRKVFTEKSFESMTETTSRSETSVTTQDELSDAIKDENRSNTKFGFTNVATYNTGVFQDSATASFSLDNSKANARETTHKKMREQSEKLSSEIKGSFKTTFKTSTEVTDTTSKRYTLKNETSKLVNYELRRKMRKVGVQVQDIGVQLCWQTFVDDPVSELGVGKLVHIAKEADLSSIKEPDAPEIPGRVPQEISIRIPYTGDDGDNDVEYIDGYEASVGLLDERDAIDSNFAQPTYTFEHPNYTLKDVSLDPQGADARLSIWPDSLVSAEGSSRGTFTVHLDKVHFHEADEINIKATLLWEPTEELVNGIKAEYDKRMGKYNAERARAFKAAFYTAARERIKLSSKIQARPAEDLREEERTVIYRQLISQLMTVGKNESKHVISELIRSIFDVDKMLYFVAPEWWTPRLHTSSQHLGEERSKAPSSTLSNSTIAMKAISAGFGNALAVKNKGTPISSDSIIDWGGAKEHSRDNYYITEDSEPAPLGSSLGWLLQLDGDDLRNAILNSPWVKAVIPIRPGMEKEAVNWLKQAHVEGEEGLDAEYVAKEGDPPELQKKSGKPIVTVKAAIDYLIGKVQRFDINSRTPIVANPSDPDDPRNHFIGSMPTEAVYEHGFYPLTGGIRFNQDGTDQVIFSQWLEILPTDQTVALEVEYDPKTLQLKVPPE